VAFKTVRDNSDVRLANAAFFTATTGLHATSNNANFQTWLYK